MRGGGPTCREPVARRGDGAERDHRRRGRAKPGGRIVLLTRAEGAHRPVRVRLLGRLEPRKGFADLIDAAARIEAPFELRIGGKGPLEAALRKRARELRLADRVSFLGELSRDGVLATLRAADCFVLASRHESFGVVLAEALACGLPVIATRSGGPSEIVAPDTGLLVDVGRPDQLAGAMAAIMRDDGQFDPEVLRRHFLERFSRTAVVAKLDAVYTRALSAG